MEWLFLLGFCTGLRCLTPTAVVCWFAWTGRFPVQGTWAFWAANILSVVVFSLAALGEYVGDTLPSTPNRTSAFPAASRVVFGGLVAAITAAAYLYPVRGAILFGVLGAVAGTWGGYHVRRYLSAKVGRDLPVALAESAFALAVSFYAAHHWAKGIAMFPPVYR